MTNSELREIYKQSQIDKVMNTRRAWEKHYAFFPKYVNGKWVWLDYYYSRYVWAKYKAGDGYTDHKWTEQFGTLFDVLRSE
jgi:hypothetical protein